MRWRRHETIEKSRRLLGFALDGNKVFTLANGLVSEEKRTLALWSNALRCVEAANGYTRLVHKIKTCVRKRQRLRSRSHPHHSGHLTKQTTNKGPQLLIGCGPLTHPNDNQVVRR